MKKSHPDALLRKTHTGLTDADEKEDTLSDDQLGGVTGGADAKGSGKVAMQDFHFTQTVNKSSP